MEQKRLYYLDMAKGIGIIGVVMLHSTMIEDSTIIWLSSFIMPLFFFISGMILSYKKESEQDMSTILKRKWHSLMIPYWGYCACYLLMDLIRLYFHSSGEVDFKKDILCFVTLYGRSVLWFIPTLFLTECGFLFLCKKMSFAGTVLLNILLPASVLPIQTVLTRLEENGLPPQFLLTVFLLLIRVLLRTFSSMPFLCLSYYLFHFFRDFWTNEKPVSFCRFVFGIFLFSLSFPLSKINEHIDLPSLSLGCLPLTYLFAAVTIFGLLLACQNIRPLKPLIYLGNNSLIIMATHMDWFLLFIAILITQKINQYIFSDNSCFRIFCTVACTLLLDLPCITVINRYFPFLAGKSGKK